MMTTLYLCACDRCGDLNIVDESTAFGAIKAAEQDEEPCNIIISRCELQRDLDSGTENCAGDVCLIGMLALSPLPTTEQIHLHTLTRPPHA